MSHRYVGIDVGERCLFGAVIETDAQSASISFSPETDPAVVLDSCATGGADGVAIDAPPVYSKGLARTGNRRVAEERLGIGGCYGTARIVEHESPQSQGSGRSMTVGALTSRYVSSTTLTL